MLAAPVDGFSAARQLRFMITSVAHYQLGNACGQPLRGGISRGLFFANDELVTGPALVKSVLMEEHAAIDPRVLLDAGCFESIIPSGTHDNRTAGNGMQWADALLVEGDGQLFVNYLLANDRVKVPAEVDSRLTSHRNLIIDRLTEFRSQPAILDKLGLDGRLSQLCPKRVLPRSLDLRLGHPWLRIIKNECLAVSLDFPSTTRRRS